MSLSNIDSTFNEMAGAVIQSYRNKKNMSLEDVVKKMKNPVSRQALFKYENNLSRMKNNIFEDICYALNENPSSIYKEIEENTQIKQIIFRLQQINRDLSLENIDFEEGIDLINKEFKNIRESNIKLNDNNIGKILYDDYNKLISDIERKYKGYILNLEDMMDKIGHKRQVSQQELLFDKSKEYLTESDWNIINTIVEQRKKQIDKELDEKE